MMASKGISGIGVLIIFIAMILVAAVAAMVLLQTVSGLEGQALATGKEAKAEVSTKFRVQSVLGKTNNPADPSSLTHLRITLKLAPGSSEIVLNNTLLRYVTQTEVVGGARYNKTPAGNNTAAGGLSSTHNTTYSAVFLNQDSGMSQMQKNAIRPEEIIEIWYKPTNLGPNENVEISFITGSGATETVYFKTPSIFAGNYVSLFP